MRSVEEIEKAIDELQKQANDWADHGDLDDYHYNDAKIYALMWVLEKINKS